MNVATDVGACVQYIGTMVALDLGEQVSGIKDPTLHMTRNTTILGISGACLLALSANANVITFTTATGATSGGGPVDASATFITGNGTVTITLTDLLANPGNVGQLLSDLDFKLSGGQTAGTLQSSSGQQISVAGNGSTTLGATGTTGWGLNGNVAGGLQLDALGFVGPAGLLIGPPGAGGVYTAANASIAGNGPHNPFLNQTATFVVNVAGVTVDSTITSATFSFGTTAGDNVPGTPPGTSVPDGGMTVALLGLGLTGLGLVRRKLS